MPFPRLMSICAGLFGLLCLGLLTVPGLFGWLFGLDPSVGAEVMARRAGVLFFGLALIFLILRRTEEARLIRRLSGATAATFAAMAALGIAELTAGRVGLGILIPVAIEAALAVLFLPHLLTRPKDP